MSNHPSWFDWITVSALVVGPVLALFAQRALDWLRERRKARVDLYHTVMAYRATFLHPESLQALNSIDVVFNGSGKKDQHVRDAWAKLIAHAYTKRPEPTTDEGRAWDARLWDLRVDLYQKRGIAVGFDYGVDYIKTHMYYPQYHADAEMEWLQIRRLLLKILSSDELQKKLSTGQLPSGEELVRLGGNEVPAKVAASREPSPASKNNLNS